MSLKLMDGFKFMNIKQQIVSGDKLKTQIVLGKNFRKELFYEVQNYSEQKPAGGIWSSTYAPLDEHASDWEHYCYAIKTGNTSFGYTFEFNKNSVIYEINDYEDLVKLIEFTNKKIIEINISEIDITNVEELNNYAKARLNNRINFIKAAEYFDAIHLTKKGEIETRFCMPLSKHLDDISNKKRSPLKMVDLNTWDCECCLILNLKALDQTSIKSYKK